MKYFVIEKKFIKIWLMFVEYIYNKILRNESSFKNCIYSMVLILWENFIFM